MRKLVVFLILIMSIQSAMAKNLGNYGAVFPIKETDFLTYIMQKINQFMQSQGGKEKYETLIRKRIEKEALNPTQPYDYLTTSKYQVYSYDPSITLKEDIVTLDGKVLGKKGERINPFKRMPFYNTDLIFIDASDLRQVNWAKGAINVLNKHHKSYHLVIVKGNLKNTYDALGQIGFDYNGTLSKKVGLKTVPSIVSEYQFQWQIQQIPCNVNQCSGGRV